MCPARVAPGMIRTPLMEVMFQDPENVKRVRAAHPIGREGQPEEVAAAIAFLLSDDSSFVTGVVLPVDGSVKLRALRHTEVTYARPASAILGARRR